MNPINKRLEKMLEQGPTNLKETNELEAYVRGRIKSLDVACRECFSNIEVEQGRIRILDCDIDTYQIKARRVMPDFKE